MGGSQLGAKFQGRGGALDALRFFAAFSLLFYHWSDNAPVSLGEFHPVFTRGYLATDFFLMLSGYVVSRAYGRALSNGAMTPFAFLTKRFKRLWPSHVIVLCMMGALIVACGLVGVTPAHPEDFQRQDFVAQVLLLNGWPGFAWGVWNYPTWTLSALFVCYAVTPLFLRATRRASWGLVWSGLTLVAADLFCLTFLGEGVFSVESGVVRALPLYFVGVAVARLCEVSSPVPSATTTRITGLGAGALLVILQAFGDLPFPSVAAIAVIIYSAGVRPVARPSRLVELGARLSLSLFLTHALVANIWFGAIHHMVQAKDAPPQAWWLIWALSFPVALVFAYGFDRLVDQPVQRWIDGGLAPVWRRNRCKVVAPGA